MAHIIIIGATGHIGSFLVPRLVADGHRVTHVGRGRSQTYHPHPAWDQVARVVLDRDALEPTGGFGPAIAALGGDVVVDMICFTPASAAQLSAALQGKVRQLIHIGTIWVHGHSVAVPTRESDPRAPFGSYGVMKSQIEDDLLALALAGSLPATVIRPGHIVGSGWAPLNPVGHFNPQVFYDIRAGKLLALPNFGLETVHHVHADDVAQVIQGAIRHPDAAIGQAFNAVSPAALTLRGYAEAVFGWFDHEPALAFLPFDQWRKGQSAADADTTLEHIQRSPCHSIEKATRLLGYKPGYTSLAAVQESVATLLAD